METRRFPPPWSAEETEACYIVRDANGQALAYVYYEQEPGRRAAAHLLTRDEARRIAAYIAKLPELLTGFQAGFPDPGAFSTKEGLNADLDASGPVGI